MAELRLPLVHVRHTVKGFDWLGNLERHLVSSITYPSRDALKPSIYYVEQRNGFLSHCCMAGMSAIYIDKILTTTITVTSSSLSSSTPNPQAPKSKPNKVEVIAPGLSAASQPQHKQHQQPWTNNIIFSRAVTSQSSPPTSPRPSLPHHPFNHPSIPLPPPPSFLPPQHPIRPIY
ncbi:hypothetical protein BO78DRAFT_453868 [Aspergillus sclerotiicarbonarius CBS 121057]|uniref:Uncharacterized protein n=1 Tax=Aspergillus sclerotiicarbonarius (strain CBS 121057 / IBT 28362) TaxID=1448318 RepID=A0A319EZ87_ASPSB|nr:hypothetical protein BO78DRAFT_453868 [Aspergillus sclerotiicarbonarius CBS 121057]